MNDNYENMLISFFEEEANKYFLPDTLFQWILEEDTAYLKEKALGMDSLIVQAEKYFERCLHIEELLLLVFLKIELKMPADLIDYLFVFCKENKILNVERILEHALFWSDQEIHTVRQVKKMRADLRDCVISVQKAFRLENRKLYPDEYNYIIAWLVQMDFSIEMITSACEITYKQTKAPIFKYANTVLYNWKKTGVKTMSDVKLRYPQFRNRRSFFDQSMKLYENTSFENG